MTNTVKIPFGINTLKVGSLLIDTVKIRVRADFPVKELQDALERKGFHDVWIRETYSPKSKTRIIIEYTGNSGKDSWERIKLIGEFLRKHAQNQLDEKYRWLLLYC